MSDTNVAQDQIKAFVDRILRMKEEADAIASDVKEIYAEARANGFDKTQMGNLVTYLRKKDKDADKVAEGEAIFDLYLTAYLGASGKVGTKRATHTYAPDAREQRSKARLSEAMDDNKAFSAELVEAGLISEEAHAENVALSDAVATKLGAGVISPVAALRADPAMAIVDPADLKTKSEPRPAPPAAQMQADKAPVDAEVGPAPSLAGVEGIADQQPIQPETAIEMQKAAGETIQTDQPEARPEGSPEIGGNPEAAQSSPKYAAPGVITWENHPPEGVERSIYSIAFSNMGQDPVLIEDELASGIAQPIVKQGNVILDGWARYMIARNMRELDGSPLSYAVVQYDGSDVLMDVIRWNVQGRVLTEQQRRAAAQMLSRQPEFKARKAEIFAAMELGMELVQ
jgi:uncharacterized protein (UPF0335 family)